MAKDQERQLAHYYFVEKGKTAKEAAALVGATERTMSLWVNKYGWKAEREARALSASARTANIEAVIVDLAAQRMDTAQMLNDALRDGDRETASALRQELARIDDGAAKWNKTLEGAKKEGRVHLSAYLDIMERIFNALRQFDMPLYLKTIEFQEQHTHEVAAQMERENA